MVHEVAAHQTFLTIRDSFYFNLTELFSQYFYISLHTGNNNNNNNNNNNTGNNNTGQ